MKTRLSVVSVPLSAMFLAVNAFSQQPASTRYLQQITVKVAPDKEAALIEHYKTGAGAKTVRARLKDNPQMLRWALLRAMYPGDPAPAANFLIGSTTAGSPVEPDPAHRDEVYKGASGMGYADYMQKVRTMSETVGSTLSHIHDITAGYAIAEGDYLVIRRLKTAEGKTADLSSLMHDMRLPLSEERVKAGNLKGWSFSHLVFPAGNSLRYDATEVLVFKDLAGAVGGPGTGGNAMALFPKLFPNKNYTNYVDAGRDTSKVVRSELYRVVVAHHQ